MSINLLAVAAAAVVINRNAEQQRYQLLRAAGSRSASPPPKVKHLKTVPSRLPPSKTVSKARHNRINQPAQRTTLVRNIPCVHY